MKPRCLGALAALMVILVLPASAAPAPPDFELKPDRFQAGFQLRGKNGHTIDVYALGHDKVAVSVSKGALSTTYRTRGSASRKGIEADFGPLGEISVRFDATARRPTHPGRLCPGPRPDHRVGTFRGTIRFEGEGGYTAVEAERASGAYFRSFRQVCGKPQQPKKPKSFAPPKIPNSVDFRPTFYIFNAESTVGDREVEFGYIEFRFDLGPRHRNVLLLSIAVAGSRERVGDVLIVRSAIGTGDEQSLRLSPEKKAPETATFTLPKPFSGSATYLEEKGTPASWTGSLGISLLGLGTVPLTGDGFEPTLCRAEGFKQFEACLTQGSGSQSQLRWDDRLSWSR